MKIMLNYRIKSYYVPNLNTEIVNNIQKQKFIKLYRYLNII